MLFASRIMGLFSKAEYQSAGASADDANDLKFECFPFFSFVRLDPVNDCNGTSQYWIVLSKNQQQLRAGTVQASTRLVKHDKRSLNFMESSLKKKHPCPTARK